MAAGRAGRLGIRHSQGAGTPGSGSRRPNLAQPRARTMQDALIPEQVAPGSRVTLEVGAAAQLTDVHGQQVYLAKLAAPTEPRAVQGRPWGYLVRYAPTLQSMLQDSPFDGARRGAACRGWPGGSGHRCGGGRFGCVHATALLPALDPGTPSAAHAVHTLPVPLPSADQSPGSYDLCVGTSERGEQTPAHELQFRPYRHALVVFGGPQGLEQCLLSDPWSAKYKDVSQLFDRYVNTCFHQGSRTIRTEEAIFISMSFLDTGLQKSCMS